MTDLFANLQQTTTALKKDIYLLRGFTTYQALAESVKTITDQAPFRFMTTPGGQRLRISMTNCGDLGWVSEPSGYRYAKTDPSNGQAWPRIPTAFSELAQQAADQCGFQDFNPNACLINHYRPGRDLSAHQDKNEPDLSQPIVSVSLGMSAHFQIYGNSRAGKPTEIELYDGDVLVWGRTARLMYHGVKTNRSQPHPELGLHRINLTFRQV